MYPIKVIMFTKENAEKQKNIFCITPTARNILVNDYPF